MTSKERKVLWNQEKACRVFRLQKAGHTAKQIEMQTGVKPHQQKTMGQMGERLLSLEVQDENQ